jgi:hypothetical protein
MKGVRLALASLGLILMGYAVIGAAGDPDIMPGRHLGFLVVVLALHDGVLLPAFIGVGALVHRFVPGRARAPVQAALIATAAVTVVALPLVLGYGRLADNPSALPRDYPLGLAIVLTTIWLAAGVCWVAPRRRVVPGRSSRP